MLHSKTTEIVPLTAVGGEGAERYLKKMASKMGDKIDFLRQHYGKFNVFIDIGCADGALLFELKQECTGMICIGYDVDSAAIERAKTKNAGETGKDVFFTADKEELFTFINKARIMNPETKVAINMSSLLHEIFTYCDETQQKDFFLTIKGINPDFITIRDFFMSDKEKLETPNPEVAQKVSDYFEVLVSPHEGIAKKGATILAAWNVEHGEITRSTESMMHLLLSCRYFKEPKEFAEREFFERYLSFSEDKLKIFTEMGYKVTEFTRYSTPDFVKILRDIGLNSVEIVALPNTKVKAIIDRKEERKSGVAYESGK